MWLHLHIVVSLSPSHPTYVHTGVIGCHSFVVTEATGILERVKSKVTVHSTIQISLPYIYLVCGLNLIWTFNCLNTSSESSDGHRCGIYTYTWMYVEPVPIRMNGTNLYLSVVNFFNFVIVEIIKPLLVRIQTGSSVCIESE